MSDPLPRYDAAYPTILQEESFDCSQTSALWSLRAYGRDTDEAWLEAQMIAEGVMTPEYGLMDASGAQLADFLNRHWGEYGYVASNVNPVSFDAALSEAVEARHPLMLGGRAWGHWTACRGADGDTLLLANPAPGYGGVWDTMNRSQFAMLGSFSLVRLTHPAAEGDVPPDPPELDYSFWTDGGKVGSGLIAMMRADAVYPAQDWSTWLPLGKNPAQIEECLSEDGTVYRWLLTVNRGYRYRPE